MANSNAKNSSLRVRGLLLQYARTFELVPDAGFGSKPIVFLSIPILDPIEF
jgi:hypothetical protein